MPAPARLPQRPVAARFLALGAVSLSAALLAACGGGDKPSATQVAAKVNKEEISVHQINHVLQRQPGLKPEQAQAAGKRVLEGLIDQELAVQQAVETKLDREPQVVMAIEAARRDILARAYADKIVATIGKPTDDEVKQYFDSKPALFAQRRIYGLQEFSIEGGATAVQAVTPIAKAAKNGEDFSKQLTAAGVKFAVRNARQPAENLPLGVLDQLAPLNPGQSVAVPTAAGVNVVFIADAKTEPVALDRAKPVIEQYLLNERKRKLLAEEGKRLRDQAQISYQGSFAAAPASAPAGN